MIACNPLYSSGEFFQGDMKRSEWIGIDCNPPYSNGEKNEANIKIR